MQGAGRGPSLGPQRQALLPALCCGSLRWEILVNLVLVASCEYWEQTRDGALSVAGCIFGKVRQVSGTFSFDRGMLKGIKEPSWPDLGGRL